MTKRINVTFDEVTYNTIQLIADRNNISMSELVRDYAYQGLKAQVGIDNIDLITKIIREQLSAILNPSVERICALSAKTGVMAATSTYLNAESISRFVPDELQEEYTITYEKARKKAIAYIKTPINQND
ncbi:MAG: hypothetical protein Q4F97_12690 [Bacteroidales bacterium]|nr:hypothetical protein [Bacteroidales bacterium]